MKARYVVGVDGGGSTTTAAVSDMERRFVAYADAGPSNPHTVGEESAFSAIHSAIRRALAEAGIGSADVAAVVLGLAGTREQADQDRATHWVREHVARAPCVVVTDAELALVAGTPAGVGLAIIAGTGSISIGRTETGSVGRAGGWGSDVGDEGSAVWIAREAIRRVVRAEDGLAPATSLREPVLRYLQASTDIAFRVELRALRADTWRMAGLARVIDGSAAEGDSDAARILEEAGRHLGETAAAVVRNLSLTRPIPLALAGGVLTGSATVRMSLVRALSSNEIACAPITVVPQPVVGALQLANRLVHAALTTQ